MALRDRIKGLAGLAGSALSNFAKTAPKSEANVSGLGTVPGYAQAGYKLNPDAIKEAKTLEALLGRISYGAGPILTRYSTYPGTALNPATLLAIFNEADLGIMLRKADLDEQVMLRDGHLQGVDRARRVAVSGKPFRVRPANESELAVNLAKFVRAVIDQIDSFDRSMYGLLLANASGYACAEIVWDFGNIRIPGDKAGQSVIIQGLYPRQLDWVHNKHFRFDLETDEPLLDIGRGGLIPLPEHKFIFHTSADTTMIEKRGYMRSVIPLHMLKTHALRDWAVWVALFGLPNILGKYPRELFEQGESKAVYETILQDFGQGKPALVPDDLQVEITQPPAGGTSQDAHGAMIGWVNTEISKAVQGETLTTELGGVGSYNASETHADVKHEIVSMDGRELAATIRSELFHSILELNQKTLSKQYNASWEEIKSNMPFAGWRIEREVGPAQRIQIFAGGVNDCGVPIGVDQFYEEFGIDPPKPGAQILKGKAIPIASGGAAIGSVEAAKGVDNPKPEEQPKAPPKSEPIKQSKAPRRRKASKGDK